MANSKYVLIVEKNVNSLKLNEAVTFDEKGKKEYRLSGVFTEFDVMNRNERIYTANKFLPHLNELMQRKATLKAVYGEFDHPDVFDTSLQRISHTIENAFFNQAANRVDGEIRLLNTHWGKEAKALVEDNCPLFVSSRAAGITESDGTVSVKKLFTYDAVADPGFGSAVMTLNESLGFKSKETNFRIYDVSDESKINELFNMNTNDFVTKTQLVEYSDYLKGEVENVRQTLNESIKNGNVEPAQINKLAEAYDTLMEQQKKVGQYLDYLADKIQIVVNENVSLKETTSKLAKHNDYLAEQLEKSINYSEYLSEELEKGINYSEYIAETLDKNIDFSEYIAEHVNKNIQFSDYLSENLEKNINYSEYIAENLDKNIAYAEYIAENVDNNIIYSEYLAENIDNNIAYAEYIAEHVDNNIAYAEYIAEHVDNNIAYAEYIAENVSDTQAYMNYIAEGLDNTIEAVKGTKLFEEVGQAQMTNMRTIDNIGKYYDEEDDFVQRTPQSQVQINSETQINDDDDQSQAPVQIQGEMEPVQGEMEPVQGEMEPVQGEMEPVQGEMEPIQGEINLQTQPQNIQPQEMTSVQNEPIGSDVQFVPGATVSIGDKTGEVLATNPATGILVVKMAENNELVEIHESKANLIGDKIMETEDSLKSYIGNLITEAKKRKASETKEPHFVQFLTEKNKKSWYDLANEDKEKVIFSINESKEQIYSEGQLLNAISNALTVQISFEDVLLENMPSELKPIWAKVNENHKKSIISTAKLYPGLDSNAKIEKFWESRRLENYMINESKQTLNVNRVVDNTTLSDNEIDSFITKIKNLG